MKHTVGYHATASYPMFLPRQRNIGLYQKYHLIFCVSCLYLIGLCPLDLGAELLHRQVQATVAAQLGFDSGQVGAPLSVINPPLVLLHPAQQILDVTHGDFIQLRPHPHGGLLQDLGGVDLSHGDLCDGHSRLEAQVVLAAEVHQPLMETIHSRARIRMAVSADTICRFID